MGGSRALQEEQRFSEKIFSMKKKRVLNSTLSVKLFLLLKYFIMLQYTN